MSQEASWSERTSYMRQPNVLTGYLHSECCKDHLQANRQCTPKVATCKTCEELQHSFHMLSRFITTGFKPVRHMVALLRKHHYVRR
jgi:hypothetical protein